MKLGQFSALIAILQGIYYIVTGIWPIVSRRSFEMVTGPKVDFWLVRTFGALISAVGSALVLSGLRREVTPSTALLAVGSAASLGGADTIYAACGRIRNIYLVEALAEFGLVGLWALAIGLDLSNSAASERAATERAASVLQLLPKYGPDHRL